MRLSKSPQNGVINGKINPEPSAGKEAKIRRPFKVPIINIYKKMERRLYYENFGFNEV
jgi:hypothetical protein